MQYEAKTIPEGINTSEQHPLREFFVLVAGLGGLILAIIFVLALSADYLVQYIPLEKENEWFSSDFTAKYTKEADAEPDPVIAKIDDYLMGLVNQLKDDTHADYRFTIRLLDDETPNAFVMPGGHIVITRGLLKTVTSENALAMVIGHEMGHQYHRHPIRSAGRGIVIVLALLVISGSESGDIAQSFIGNTAGLANLAYSRDQERTADQTGVEMLTQFYGHAQGASEFFEKIRSQPDYKSGPPIFLSTHPGTEERIDFLREFENKKQGDLTALPDYITEYINVSPKP